MSYFYYDIEFIEKFMYVIYVRLKYELVNFGFYSILNYMYGIFFYCWLIFFYRLNIIYKYNKWKICKFEDKWLIICIVLK